MDAKREAVGETDSSGGENSGGCLVVEMERGEGRVERRGGVHVTGSEAEVEMEE